MALVRGGNFGLVFALMVRGLDIVEDHTQKFLLISADWHNPATRVNLPLAN